MIPMPTSRRARILLALSAAALVVGAAFALRRPPAPPAPEPVIPKRVSLAGEVICLAPVGGGTATDECRAGLRADDGRKYALDFSAMSSVPAAHRTGDRVSAWGVVTPVERLNADYWRRYDVAAVFSVTDSFKVLE